MTELEEGVAVQEGLSEDEQREADRRAAHMAHPHTHLRGIIADLRAPGAISGDSATKHAHLYAAVVRLAQVILSHTPEPPEEPHGEG